MKTGRWIVTAVLLLLGTGAAAGAEVTVDGVLHIQNGAPPPQGIETLHLKELWRAGGADDEVFFGMIVQVLADDDGNIYLLDRQLNEVQVYSPEGENIKTLSREGDGPGEIRGPADMFFLPDGTLGIIQGFPGRIIRVDLDGNPAGDIQAGATDATQGGVIAFTNAIGSGDHIVISGVRISPKDYGQDRKHFISSFDLEGNELLCYYDHTQVWDFSNFELSERGQYFPHGRYTALSDDGRVYTVPQRNKYAINVYLPDGTPDRVIEREYKSVKRDEDEMKLINAAMEAAKGQFPFEIKTSVEETEPDISRIWIAPDGMLWVLTSRGQRDQDENVIVTFDVFDRAGHFVKQVAVAGDGDGTRDFLMFAGGNRVVLITGFLDAAANAQGVGGALAGAEEAEPMEIICYEY